MKMARGQKESAVCVCVRSQLYGITSRDWVLLLLYSKEDFDGGRVGRRLLVRGHGCVSSYGIIELRIAGCGCCWCIVFGFDWDGFNMNFVLKVFSVGT